MLFVYDVAQQWREMTGKPSVLAVWAARRDVVTPEIVADFLASREYGLAQSGDIAEGAALEARSCRRRRWSATCARASIIRSTRRIWPLRNIIWRAAPTPD